MGGGGGGGGRRRRGETDGWDGGMEGVGGRAGEGGTKQVG